MEESLRPDLLLEQLFDLPERDYSQYSPLTLAYMGDVVYDLVIRTILVRRGNAKPEKLHHQTASVVRATAQAAAIRALLEDGLLTEEEAAVYRRGKNSKPYNTAKHATRKEYLEATGYEALLGYLYLKKEYARVLELIYAALQER